MAVICDTSKIGATWDKSIGYWIVYIRRLKSNGKKDVKFAVSKDANLTKDEVFTLFFEKLERGELRQRKSNGGKILRQKADGTYYFEAPNTTPAVKVEKTDNVSPSKTTVRYPISSVGSVLFDTHAPEARALIGKMVTGSTAFVFPEGTTYKGVLDSVNGGFHIKTNEGVVVVPFIRELRPEPLNFNDAEVRRSLLGTIIVAKDGNVELLLNNAVKNGAWKINGLSSTQMMNGYTFIDGSPIMASN